MGLQPLDSAHTPPPRSGMAHSPPKNVTGQRRHSGPREDNIAAAVAKPPSSTDQKLTPRIIRTTHNGGTVSAPGLRRPQRHSVGETAPRPSGGTTHAPASPRRPTRHSFSMPVAPRIREEPNGDEEDIGDDEVDGFSTVFDTSRLANSPKPPRKFPTARPLRHSVCGGVAEAAASAAVGLREGELSEDPADTAAAVAAAADRKRKRVRFSVPDIRLTEEQLEAFAVVAANAAAVAEKDRENQLAAPCSDAFRKAMLDMRFLSVEQGAGAGEAVPEESEGDASFSSSPSVES